MSNYSDYERADCDRFRLPPIDYSKIAPAIEAILVNAWRNGNSAQRVIDSLVNNDSVVSQVSAQIEDSLEYQMARMLESTEVQADSAVADIEARKQGMLTEVDQRYDADIYEKKQTYDAASQEFTAKAQEYTAAEQKLLEIRQNVESKLEAIGGEEGLDMLLEINQSVIDYKAAQESYTPVPEEKKPYVPRERKPKPEYEAPAQAEEPEVKDEQSWFERIFSRIRLFRRRNR